MPKLEGFDALFGPALRQAREERSVTQEELARFMDAWGYGFQQSTINKIESGDRRVTVGEAIALSDSLNVPLETLVVSGPNTVPWAVRNLQKRVRKYLEDRFAATQVIADLDAARTEMVNAAQSLDRIINEYEPAEYRDEFKRHYGILELLDRTVTLAADDGTFREWAEKLTRSASAVEELQVRQKSNFSSDKSGNDEEPERETRRLRRPRSG